MLTLVNTLLNSLLPEQHTQCLRTIKLLRKGKNLYKNNLWKLPFYIAIFFAALFLLLIIYSIVKLALEETLISLGSYRVMQALKVSLVSSFISSTLAFSLALPISYALSRKIIPGTRVIETLTLIFLGLPPVGIGIALIAFFSSTASGSFLDSVLEIIFTFKGIVIAQTLVIFPIVVKFTREIIDSTSVELEEVYQVFGANRLQTLIKIIIPSSAKGLFGAWLIGWLRSLGEFGATLVVAGVVVGKTETLTILMYSFLASADIINASRIMLILVMIVIIGSYFLQKLFQKNT